MEILWRMLGLTAGPGALSLAIFPDQLWGAIRVCCDLCSGGCCPWC